MEANPLLTGELKTILLLYAPCTTVLVVLPTLIWGMLIALELVFPSAGHYKIVTLKWDLTGLESRE